MLFLIPTRLLRHRGRSVGGAGSRPPAQRLCSHGGGSGDPAGCHVNLLPQPRSYIKYSCKDTRGYTSDHGGHGLYSVSDLPEPVWPRAQVEPSWVEITCVHGDIHRYPMVPVEIICKDKRIQLRLWLALDLAPLILGPDFGVFRADVRRWCMSCHECQLVNPAVMAPSINGAVI